MCEELRGTVPELYKCVCGGTAYIRFGELGYTVRCERDPGLAEAPPFRTEKKAIREWNKAQEEMEQLTVDAVRAYHRRLSYGQYIAQLPVAVPAVRYPKKQSAEAPVVELRCLHCGMLIPASSRSKKYCCADCAEKYRDKQKQIRKKLAGAIEVPKEPERMCAMCGNPIPPESGRYRYCCEACAQKAIQIQSREFNKRRRARRR